MKAVIIASLAWVGCATPPPTLGDAMLTINGTLEGPSADFVDHGDGTTSLELRLSPAGTTCHQVQLADETDSYTTVVGVQIFAPVAGSSPIFLDEVTADTAIRFDQQSGSAMGPSVGTLELATIADDEIAGTLSATGTYRGAPDAQIVATFRANRCPAMSP